MRIIGAALLVAALSVSVAWAEASPPASLMASKLGRLVKVHSGGGQDFQGLKITLVAGGAALAQKQ